MSCFIFFWNSSRNRLLLSISWRACWSLGRVSSCSCKANSATSLSVSEVIICCSLRSFSRILSLCTMKSFRLVRELASMPGKNSSRTSSSSRVRRRAFFTSPWFFRKRSRSSIDIFCNSLRSAVFRRSSIKSSTRFFSTSLFFLALSSLSLRFACLSRLNLNLSSSPTACASTKFAAGCSLNICRPGSIGFSVGERRPCLSRNLLSGWMN